MTKVGKKQRRWGWGASAAILMALTAPVAAIAQEQTYRFELPAQDLSAALRAFGQQSNQQIIFSDRDVRGKQSAPLEGSYSADEGLRLLLGSSGLLVTRTRAGVLVVHDPASPTELGGVGPGQPSEYAADEEEIVVTGTLIRGQAPIGSSVITIDADEIAQSRRSSVQDFLQTVPQNFGAASAEVSGGAGNFGRGSSINLRGLGAGATLTLVNGRRQPQSGDNGDFVDISAIPVSAISRIEILTDGASAIYGSDAIGGVVNIILKDGYDGADTTFHFGSAGGDANDIVASQSFGAAWESGELLAGYQYRHRGALAARDRDFAASLDKRPFGGSDFRNHFSNPGNILNPTTLLPAFAIPTGPDGTALTVGDLLPGVVNLGDPAAVGEILPETEEHSLFLSAHQDLNANARLFAELHYNRHDYEVHSGGSATNLSVPASNPFYVNPFPGGAPVRIAYNFTDDLGPVTGVGDFETISTAFGLDYDFGNDWLSITHISGRSDFGADLDVSEP